jgi:hypothetical protein
MKDWEIRTEVARYAITNPQSSDYQPYYRGTFMAHNPLLNLRLIISDYETRKGRDDCLIPKRGELKNPGRHNIYKDSA